MSAKKNQFIDSIRARYFFIFTNIFGASMFVKIILTCNCDSFTKLRIYNKNHKMFIFKVKI